MTTVAPDPTTDVPAFSVAGAFLEALAARDFERLGATLSETATLRALLPPELAEREGVEAIVAMFVRWFGNVDAFELVEATVGEVGRRLHLRWRVRVRAERFGDGWMVVEQQAYADTDPRCRIAALSLLCSGYCAELAAA